MDLSLGLEQSFWDTSTALDAIPLAGPPLGTAPFLSSALASARVGTWQLDMTTGLVAMDSMASSFLHLDGIPYSDFSLNSVLEEDRERIRRSMREAVKDGVPHEIEYRVQSASGEVRWLYSLSGCPGEGSDNGRYLRGIVYDVTDRKQAQIALLERERQQSAIVASLPGVAYRCAVEPPWTMTFIGGAVEQLTGHTAEAFLAKAVNWAKLVHPNDAALVTAKLTAAVQTQSQYQLKYRIVRPDGSLCWVHEKGRAAYSEGGDPLFLEGFIGDIHEQTIAEEKLRDAEERYRLVSQAAMEVIWDLDLASDEITFNEAMVTVLRHDPKTIRPTAAWWRDQVHPEDRDRVSAAIGNLIRGAGSRYMGEHRFKRGDGTYADIYTRCQVMRDADSQPVRLLGSLMDLSELKLSDAALRESEAINRSIVEASIDCVMLLELDGTLRFMNASGAIAMEVSDVNALYERPWADLWPAETLPLVSAAIETARNGGIGRFTACGQTLRGNTRWGEVVVSPVTNEHGKAVKLVAISRDITERREDEHRLVWSATRDALTGLPNRALFQRTLHEAVNYAAGARTKIGLLVLDLDHFKQVNDTLGHDAGDTLLQTVGARLEAFSTREDGGIALAARLGGDEFALILDGVRDQDELALRAGAVLCELRAPFVYAGRILDCHATMGAALYPDHGAQPEELLKSADIALYAAKSSRRGRAVTFESAHRAEIDKRQLMIALAREALAGDRVVPFYQPKLCLDDGSIYGFEALLRWQHDRDGMQLPATISAAFEDLELAAAISDRIIDRVITDMRKWLDRGVPFGHVAVNAAAAEFRSDRFAESVLGRLEKAGVPTRHFQLEVTETVFLGRGAEYVERALRLLSEAGVSIALDDFGTGYASLRHLKQFPVDVIKIDRSFVQNMETDPEDAAIIDAVLNLGMSLNIEVVAEGVETISQAVRLQETGCRYGQGFLFSHAVPADRVALLFCK